MEGLNNALLSIIPDVRKGVMTSDRPKEEASRLGQPEVQANGKKTGPYGEQNIGGNGGGVMAKLSQYPTLQSNDPLSALNMPAFPLEPALHSTELDANRKLPYQRYVAPMASGVPMKLKKGQILFTHRTNTGASPIRRVHTFADTTKLGYGNPPSYTVDVVTLNYIILKEQLQMYLERDRNNNYRNLDPTYFLKDWRLDGIAEKDSVPASSMNLYEKVIVIKASQVECQNYFGGKYKTGDEVYLMLKKYDWVENKDLDRIYQDCPGLSFGQYANNISFKPYQFGAYTTSDLQADPLARQYVDDLSGLTRYDGLPICVGKVWAEPRFHSVRNGSYGKDDGGKSTNGHALRNPNVGISSETVTNLVIIMNSDGGENPF